MAHVDRYAHRRPGYSDNGHPDRSHYQADGTPKKPLTQAQAEGAALTLAARQGGDVNAYECPVCGRWHTGRASARKDAAS